MHSCPGLRPDTFGDHHDPEVHWRRGLCRGHWPIHVRGAAWVTNEGSKTALTAAESEVRAADVALQGVQREAQAGQRTTVDVLNALQYLTNARARLITSQRDRVVASYTLLTPWDGWT